MQDQKNRVVVITGAYGGLGRLVAHKLAETGSSLVLVGPNADKLAILGSELNLSEERWLTIAADLSQKDTAIKVFEASIAKFGHVEILLNFVGGWIGGKSVPQVDSEDLISMLQQHLWTTFFLSQTFVPHLIENKWGRIIVVSSPSAGNPPANSLPYSVAKSAQEALILTLAEELKGSGVTANILRVRTIDVDNEKKHNPTIKNSNWTTPEEVTAAIQYLCSDQASTVNGARIPLYGSP